MGNSQGADSGRQSCSMGMRKLQMARIQSPRDSRSQSMAPQSSARGRCCKAVARQIVDRECMAQVPVHTEVWGLPDLEVPILKDPALVRRFLGLVCWKRAVQVGCPHGESIGVHQRRCGVASIHWVVHGADLRPHSISRIATLHCSRSLIPPLVAHRGHGLLQDLPPRRVSDQ